MNFIFGIHEEGVRHLQGRDSPIGSNRIAPSPKEFLEKLRERIDKLEARVAQLEREEGRP